QRGRTCRRRISPSSSSPSAPQMTWACQRCAVTYWPPLAPPPEPTCASDPGLIGCYASRPSTGEFTAGRPDSNRDPCSQSRDADSNTDRSVSAYPFQVRRIDRLLHNAIVLNIRGHSYRMRGYTAQQKEKEGGVRVRALF